MITKTQPLTQAFLHYGCRVPGIEPFYERFARVLLEGGLSDTEAAAVMGLSAAQISRIKKGVAESIRFEDGLKLCERLGIDPWYLAFGRERAIQPGSYDQGGALQSLEGQVAQHDRDLLEIAKTQKTILETLRVLQGAQPKRRSQ